MIPAECQSIADVLALERSYQVSGVFSMMIQHDGAVILCDHPPGQACQSEIVIPRRHFKRLLEFYQADQANELIREM